MSNGPVNSSMSTTMATWPPDYNPYLNFAGENAVLQALENEANSKRAPASYRQFLTTMRQILLRMRLGISDRDKKVDTLEADLAALTEYLENSRQNYDELYSILKDERTERRELEHKVDTLQKQLTEQQQQQQTPAQPATAPAPPSSTPSPVSMLPAVRAQPQQQQTHVHSPTSSAFVADRTPPMAAVPLVTTAVMDDVQKRLADRVKEYEKQLSRSAQGRRAMENQIIEQYNTINSQHARIKELEAEVTRLKNAYQQARNESDRIARMIAPFVQSTGLVHNNPVSSAPAQPAQAVYINTNNPTAQQIARNLNLQYQQQQQQHQQQHPQQQQHPPRTAYDPSQRNQ